MNEKDIDDEEEINTNEIKIEEEKEEEKKEDEKDEEKEGEEEKKEENNEDKEEVKLLDLHENNNEFDENLYFNHYYLAQRQMEVEPIITGQVFPYMMSREFLYSYFEDKKNYKNATNETYPQILGRVKQFTNSNDDNFNKIFLDNIQKYSEFLGKEKSNTIIIPVLSKIVGDKINTKIYFLTKLESYIEYLTNLGEDGLLIIKNNILNIFEELYRVKFKPSKNVITNKNYKVTSEQQEKYDTLLFERFTQVSKILIKTEFKDYIFNMILNFGKSNGDENEKTIEKKKLCIKLITNLSAEFEEDFTKENILPQLDEFMKDDNVEIKEETVSAYITLAKILNIEFIGNYILDSLEKISNDKSWTVRKKCLEVLYKIIYELKNKYKKENNDYDKIAEYIKKLILIIEKFVEDKKKKVRMFLIEKIGEIIKPLDKEELSEKLFDFYVKTLDEYYSNEDNSINSENKTKINYYLAYNFPAVLFYYTVDYWTQLKSVYNMMCNDEDIYVRRSIISSFYEVSKILGDKITVKELLPLYDKFLENKQSSYTRKLAEENLPKILSILSKEIREKYINNNNIGFNNIISNDTFLIKKSNQNKKIDFLNNILTYFKLYDDDIIYNNILSKCIFFSMDSIYKVRTTSCKIIAEIIIYLYKKDYKKDNICKLLETYAFNVNYPQRIIFSKICKTVLILDDVLYNEKLKELLFTLANKEQNFNVLLAMAKSLIKVISAKNTKCGEDTSIHYLCKKINTGKCLSISNLFKTVNLKKNEKLEIVGNLREGDVFILGNNFFEEEFGIEIKKKKNNTNENIINVKDNEENKFIN